MKIEGKVRINEIDFWGGRTGGPRQALVSSFYLIDIIDYIVVWNKAPSILGLAGEGPRGRGWVR
jgi:hypothetical protein